MSSLLNQAVELAQAGQRDQARLLLWQYIQTNPDNEVAWLWLASVAADQPEYVRALNEVLRINPSNARAQQLLNDFQQQYGSVRGASTPPFAQAAYTPSQTPAESPSSTPVSPPPSPPPTPAYQPPPPVQPAYTPDYDYGQPYGETRKAKEPERVIERVVERRGGRGCLGCMPGGCGCLGCGGCGQSCLVAIVLLIVLPAVLCAGLSYANFSLGPLDFPASFLPDKFGMKTIRFDHDPYEIKLDVPRSWYLASDQNDMWLMWRDALDQVAQFDNSTQTWEDFENEPRPLIIETNPVTLHLNGFVVAMRLSEEIRDRDFDCQDIAAQGDQFDTITTYSGNLCGYTNEFVEPYTCLDIFTDSTPPTDIHTYVFVVPVTGNLGLQWELSFAEDMTDFYRPRIERLIESVEVTQK